MEIGVQTKGIIEKGVDIQKGFTMIAEAGFTKVDFNLDIFLTNSEIYRAKLNPFFDVEIEKLLPFFSSYKEAMKQTGITPSQMHAPYPVKVPGNVAVSDYMKSCVIPKSIAIAQELEVPWVVVHPFKTQYSLGKAAEWTENIEYFKQLIPLLKERGVRLCLENLYESIGGRLVEGVCANPLDAIGYIDTLNNEAGEELFGLCLDTGHLQICHRDPYDYITRVGSRLKLLHLHENNGRDDLHEMPYTFGDSNTPGLDWEGVAQGLAEIDFDGTLSYETFPCMNAFPYTVRREVLGVIYAAGESRKAQIEAFRRETQEAI